MYNNMNNFICVFFHTSCSIKYTDNRNKSQKKAPHNPTLAHFYKVNNSNVWAHKRKPNMESQNQ